MSAPNNTYDPVRVAALAPAEVERMTEQGLAAIAAASTFDDLKEAEVAHRGRQAPLTQASAEIGALPPEGRAEAGRRVGLAKKRLDDALAARHAQLEADQDRRVLEDETADVTLPWDRTPAGARHPVATLADRLADVFIGMGYEIAQGDAGHVLHRRSGWRATVWHGAAHAYLAGADQGHADQAAAALRGQPGQVLPQ
jgi:phenylalanyl-tRNA synthetase alpha chain